jgi:hypothetical protein
MRLSAFHFLSFVFGEWRIANSEEGKGPHGGAANDEDGILSPIRHSPASRLITVAFQQKLAVRERERARLHPPPR